MGIVSTTQERTSDWRRREAAMDTSRSRSVAGVEPGQDRYGRNVSGFGEATILAGSSSLLGLRGHSSLVEAIYNTY